MKRINTKINKKNYRSHRIKTRKKKSYRMKGGANKVTTFIESLKESDVPISETNPITEIKAMTFNTSILDKIRGTSTRNAGNGPHGRAASTTPGTAGSAARGTAGIATRVSTTRGNAGSASATLGTTGNATLIAPAPLHENVTNKYKAVLINTLLYGENIKSDSLLNKEIPGLGVLRETDFNTSFLNRDRKILIFGLGLQKFAITTKRFDPKKNKRGFTSANSISEDLGYKGLDFIILIKNTSNSKKLKFSKELETPENDKVEIVYETQDPEAPPVKNFSEIVEKLKKKGINFKKLIKFNTTTMEPSITSRLDTCFEEEDSLACVNYKKMKDDFENTWRILYNAGEDKIKQDVGLGPNIIKKTSLELFIFIKIKRPNYKNGGILVLKYGTASKYFLATNRAYFYPTYRTGKYNNIDELLKENETKLIDKKLGVQPEFILLLNNDGKDIKSLELIKKDEIVPDPGQFLIGEGLVDTGREIEIPISSYGIIHIFNLLQNDSNKLIPGTVIKGLGTDFHWGFIPGDSPTYKLNFKTDNKKKVLITNKMPDSGESPDLFFIVSDNTLEILRPSKEKIELKDQRETLRKEFKINFVPHKRYSK